MTASRTQIPILDHGYIQLIESWGSDEMIVESARMSTGKGFLGWGHYRQCRRCEQVDTVDVAGSPSPPGGCPVELDGGRVGVGLHDWRNVPKGDTGLLQYMWEHRHDTPFEFGGMIVEVKAPLTVFREWHRHRSQGYSEASARYAPLPADDYMPTVARCMMGGGANRQAGRAAGAQDLTADDALAWLSALAGVYEHAELVYQAGLKAGIPKELARLSMTVGRYSKMRATTNLRMWLAFASLRSTGKNPHAQWEIRQYADAACGFLNELFPRTLALFEGAAR